MSVKLWRVVSTANKKDELLHLCMSKKAAQDIIRQEYGDDERFIVQGFNTAWESLADFNDEGGLDKEEI
jgi:hypothetical protein